MSVFGSQWDSLPTVMQKHYANRGYSSDRVTADGVMKVEISWLLKALSPFMHLTGTLAPYAGENIPVSVTYESERGSNAFCLNRVFHYPGRPVCLFRSRMVPIGNNDIVDFVPCGLGWHIAYEFDGQKVHLRHIGYKIRLFGKIFPFPVTWLLGKIHAQEVALSEERFAMSMEIRHWLFGKIYSYGGQFTISNIDMRE